MEAKDIGMKAVSLEELLEAGCHFGHQVTRHNPKARDYIFEARDNIHIIDLEKTKEGLDEAMVYVQALARRGGTMIILGAKRQAADIVKEEVARAKEENADGLFFVTNRWIGGILTNFSEITKNFKRLKQLTDRLNNPDEKAKYTKKEMSLWEKERAKLAQFYSGIADMQRTPDAVFIIDTHLEHLAVREAIATGVKTVGMTDTNADPTLINYAIPANDDAVGSIKLITHAIVDAWVDGRKAAEKDKAEAEKKAAANEAPSDAKAMEGKKASKGASETKEVKAEEKQPAKKATKPVKKPAPAKAAADKPAKKAVKTAKEKIDATKETPEKISVE